MQPVDFNDDVANSAERCTKRKIKRLELVDKLKSNDSTPVTSPLISKILVLETQPRSPVIQFLKNYFYYHYRENWTIYFL